MIIAKGLINFFGLHQTYEREEGGISLYSCYPQLMIEDYFLVKEQGKYYIENRCNYMPVNASSLLDALGLFRKFLRTEKGRLQCEIETLHL